MGFQPLDTKRCSVARCESTRRAGRGACLAVWPLGRSSSATLVRERVCGKQATEARGLDRVHGTEWLNLGKWVQNAVGIIVRLVHVVRFLPHRRGEHLDAQRRTSRGALVDRRGAVETVPASEGLGADAVIIHEKHGE